MPAEEKKVMKSIYSCDRSERSEAYVNLFIIVNHVRSSEERDFECLYFSSAEVHAFPSFTKVVIR